MLNYMRRHAQSTTVKILFWIIIAVFMLWGVGTFTGSDTLNAAVVNGETISPKEVRRAAQQLERFYQQIYGENLTPELVKNLDFKNRALDQMINSALLKQEALRLGFSVSDEEVREAIQGAQGLQVEGRFQREVYFRYLRMQGITPTEFEDQTRDRLLVQKLQQLIAGSLRSDEAGAKELYVFQNERVNLQFLRIKAREMAKDLHPSDAELAKYYEEHRDMFRQPERVAIDYVAYEAKDFEKSVQVSEADVAQEYDAFKQQRYSSPEQVHVRHVLLSIPDGADAKKRDEIRARAAAVLARLKSGEDFAKVAQSTSDDKATRDKGGDLGFIARGSAEEAFENAAFALQPGQLSDVIETGHGLHVIRLEERTPAREKPLAEVHDEIVAALRTDRARSAARDAAFADSEKASSGGSLQELAQSRGLKVDSPPAFAQNDEILGLSRQPDLAKSAFATPAGQIGPVTSAGDSLILFRVREKRPSYVPELKEVRAAVEDALRDELGAAKAHERAEQIRKSLGEGHTLEGAAATEKLTVEETGLFTRSGAYVPRIGSVPELKKAAFALSESKSVAPGVYVASGDAFVAVFESREPADLAEFEKKKPELVKRHLDEQRQAAMEALLNQLKRRAKIRVNSAALAAV